MKQFKESEIKFIRSEEENKHCKEAQANHANLKAEYDKHLREIKEWEELPRESFA